MKVILLMSSKGSRKYLYLTVCTGNFLALAAGISMAWTSPVLPKLLQKENIHVNPFGKVISLEEASWIGSLLPLGGIFGTFAAGFSSARIGRKNGVLLCSAVPFLSAYLILAFSKTVYLYYIARLIAGFGVSSVYTILPLYNGEIAEDSIRGYICSSITIFETAGELFSYCVGPYVTIFWFCIASTSLTLTFSLLIIMILPESPYYLIDIENRNGAEQSLMKLRSDTRDGVKSELEFIENVVNDSKANHGTIFDILKSKALRKAQMITLGLTVFQHLSGIIPILFYAQTIFDETGSSLPPEICSIIIGAVQFCSSFITPNLVDKLGRRWMLFISAAGMCVSEAHLGLYFFWKNGGKNVSTYYWLPVVCLISYMISYIMGFGPLPWTVMGEIFPSNMKAAASTVTVCVCWSLAFIISKSFISILEVIGPAGSFWIFSGSCCLAALFINTYMIETKSKNFQEIQDALSK